MSEIEEDDLTAEYLLPVFVDEQLKKGEMKVTVIPTGSLWFGVTYKEDRPAVVEILKEFHEQGLY